MDKDGYNDTQEAYERGFIDGMQKQMQSSVDKAVNSMTRTWVGLTDKEIAVIGSQIYGAHHWDDMRFYREVEAKLKEKNT